MTYCSWKCHSTETSAETAQVSFICTTTAAAAAHLHMWLSACTITFWNSNEKVTLNFVFPPLFFLLLSFLLRLRRRVVKKVRLSHVQLYICVCAWMKVRVCVRVSAAYQSSAAAVADAYSSVTSYSSTVKIKMQRFKCTLFLHLTSYSLCCAVYSTYMRILLTYFDTSFYYLVAVPHRSIQSHREKMAKTEKGGQQTFQVTVRWIQPPLLLLLLPLNDQVGRHCILNLKWKVTLPSYLSFDRTIVCAASVCDVCITSLSHFCSLISDFVSAHCQTDKKGNYYCCTHLSFLYPSLFF